MNNIKLLGFTFTNLEINKLVKYINFKFKFKKKIIISTVNAAKIIQSKNDKFLNNFIKKSSIVTIDGMSIVFAGKLLSKKKLHRVSGYDLMEKLFTLSLKRKISLFFLGSKKNVIKQAVKNVKKKYPKIHISGFNDGFFWDNEKQLIKRINKLKPKILLIGMTSPTQEMFVQEYGNSLNVKLIILLGGSFDVLSGKLKRAPILLQNMGLEWAFRLAQEPRRLFWRYLTTNSQFIYMVLKQYLGFK